MKVLAIDTSNRTMSVALADESGTVAEYTTNANQNHSVQLMPAIERLMEENRWKPSDLHKIIVAKGPGSYTGVRIGVTVAKTLAWTLGAELVGVSSLEVVARRVTDFEGYIAPVFDARRGQVFTALFKKQGNLFERVQEDKLHMANDWVNQLRDLNQPILFISVDVPIHEATFEQSLGENALFASDEIAAPSASVLAAIGKHLPGEDVHTFVPNYARLAEAETNWLQAQKGAQK